MRGHGLGCPGIDGAGVIGVEVVDQQPECAVFKSQSFAQWRELLEGTDTCFAPVLTPGEAPGHPHNVERGTFVEVDGVVQPAPAPRFTRTPPGPLRSSSDGDDTADVLAGWGLDRSDVAGLLPYGDATTGAV